MTDLEAVRASHAGDPTAACLVARVHLERGDHNAARDSGCSGATFFLASEYCEAAASIA